MLPPQTSWLQEHRLAIQSTLHIYVLWRRTRPPAHAPVWRLADHVQPTIWLSFQI